MYHKKCTFITIILLAFFVVFLFLKAINTPKIEFTSCISIGNALEAPKDLSWDVEMNEEYFDKIKEAGFDCVRLPVRFSDYAKDNKDYLLDESFMKKIDYYIDYALSKKLVIILDFHHFIEIMKFPNEYKECYLKIWDQVAERYKDYPQELMFELLNEPNDNLSGELWNQFIDEGVNIIRKSNPKRTIIVGPDNYYSVYSLEKLKIPQDKNIVVSFHYYEPNEVTFQGSVNHKGFENLKDNQWTGTNLEIQYLKSRFEIAKKYSEDHKVRIFLGEFGVNKNAPETTRINWTQAVRKEAEEYGFSWGYWELCSEFGIYDVKNDLWNEKILDSLLEN